MGSTDYGPWDPLSLDQVAAHFADAPMRWWVTGGLALELHFQQSWRSHDDTDVSVLRSEVQQLRHALADWQIHLAAAGVLTLWAGEPTTKERSQNNLWCRQTAADPWRLDVPLSDGDDAWWIYRRDPSIRRPWDEAVLTAADGTPYLAPELQLLFKSRNHRPKDDVDAATAIPLLGSTRAQWLATHLDDAHPWQALIK